MEKRVLKLLPMKSGNGAITYRVSIPKKWCDMMGVSVNEREMLFKFDGEQITIEKNKMV